MSPTKERLAFFFPIFILIILSNPAFAERDYLLKQGQESSIVLSIKAPQDITSFDEISAELEGAAYLSCIFYQNGSPISPCEGLALEKVEAATYNLSIDTSSLPSGSYNASLKAKTNSGVFSSEKVQLRITEQRHTLFDIYLRIFEKEIPTGGRLGVSVGLINLGDPGKVDANLLWKIKDSKGNVLQTETQVVRVETQKEFLKYFSISSFKTGKYSLTADLSYIGQKEPAQAVGEFSITSQKIQGSFIFSLFAQTVLFSLILTAVLIGIRRGVLKVLIGSILNTSVQ